MIGNKNDIIRWLETQSGTLFEIKDYRHKRSRNANNYCWALINQIASALGANMDDIYLLMLKRYGQSEMVSVVSTINPRGYFKYYSEAGRTFLQGKEFTHYKVYKGSSEMNSWEMSKLIDGVISEAKMLDIPTAPQREIERMKAQWKNA